MEWGLLAGPMYRPMLILTVALPIQGGHGGVAGEEAGVVAGGAGAAGAGLHPIGTPGGKTIKLLFLRR